MTHLVLIGDKFFGNDPGDIVEVENECDTYYYYTDGFDRYVAIEKGLDKEEYLVFPTPESTIGGAVLLSRRRRDGKEWEYSREPVLIALFKLEDPVRNGGIYDRAWITPMGIDLGLWDRSP